ncbi:CPCC family cysteine-rich protein [Microbulbifer echini]|uniref:CPCC family cysteine-rich protein n=1 Tax=Microbulbifer echini TaxID=1529067 RepID=A0ABV4NTW2_9GAMM|nr:CPCC family cysteine-rich protein [uncultured Microbulbifer sp.]
MKLAEYEIGSQLVQCGCCDYYSLVERGKCLICPVCYWEDDYDCTNENGLVLDIKSDLNNDFTLVEARENFKRYGAWLEKFSGIVLSEEERKNLKYEQRNV